MCAYTDFFLRNHFQKQPSSGVLIKGCSENKQEIFRRTPVPKCDFNKVGLHSMFSEQLLLRESLEEPQESLC